MFCFWPRRAFITGKKCQLLTPSSFTLHLSTFAFSNALSSSNSSRRYKRCQHGKLQIWSAQVSEEGRCCSGDWSEAGTSISHKVPTFPLIHNTPKAPWHVHSLGGVSWKQEPHTCFPLCLLISIAPPHSPPPVGSEVDNHPAGWRETRRFWRYIFILWKGENSSQAQVSI